MLAMAYAPLLAILILEYLVRLVLCGGAPAAVYGAIYSRPPKRLCPDGTPRAPPAVECVMLLSCQFSCVLGAFLLASVLGVLRGFPQGALKDGMDAIASSRGFAPMLVALPFGFTCALFAQTMLCIAIPVMLGVLLRLCGPLASYPFHLRDPATAGPATRILNLGAGELDNALRQHRD